MSRSIVAVCLAIPALAFAVTRIASERASRHVGETATVCGPVVEVHHAWRSRGAPTFIDFDAAYHHEDFTVVVWAEDAGNFGDLAAYDGKNVCATGLIRDYLGVPEIVASERKQLKAE